MSIKQGYKQTDIGIIPEEWEVKTLGKIGEFSKGQGIKKDDAQSGDIPCIRYGELYTRHNDYVKQFYSFISKDIAKTAKRLKFGDILFAGSGETKEEIGKCAAFMSENETYAGGDIVILSPKDVNSLFLGFLLNTPLLSKQKASFGQGDAVVHISASSLKKVKIPTPSVSEQKAIAQALSDTDALITALDTLIEKKRLIKQGTMQQLLTGKRRLEGFNEEWEVKEFGELVFLRKSKYDSYKSGSHSFCIELEHIGQGAGSILGYTETKSSSSLKNVFKKDDILFGKLRAYLRKYWIANRDGVASSEVWVFASNEISYSEYIFQLVQTNQFIEAAVESFGTHMPRSDWNIVKRLPISTPSVSEQKAIADILSDMDNEIAILETKRHKYQQLKQGMMQELLTGKTRLV